MESTVSFEELVLGLARWKVPVAPVVGALYQEGQRLLHEKNDPAGAMVQFTGALAAAAGDWHGLHLGPYLDLLLKLGHCHRGLGDAATAVRLFEVRQAVLEGNPARARGTPWWPDRLTLVLSSDRTSPSSTAAQIRQAVLAELSPGLWAANAAELAASLWQRKDFAAAADRFEAAFRAYLAAGLPAQAKRPLRTYASLALRDGLRDHLADAARQLRRCRLPLDGDDLALLEAAGIPPRTSRFPRFFDQPAQR